MRRIQRHPARDQENERRGRPNGVLIGLGDDRARGRLRGGGGARRAHLSNCCAVGWMRSTDVGSRPLGDPMKQYLELPFLMERSFAAPGFSVVAEGLRPPSDVSDHDAPDANL